MKTIRTTTPKSIDEYIRAAPADVRPLLKKIRATIRAAVPEAQEVISYGMPAFKRQGITRIVRLRAKQDLSRASAGKKAGAKAKPVRLLSGGNPQIAKADGAVPVQAYIAAMPGWKRHQGPRLVPGIPRLHQLRQSHLLPGHVPQPVPPGGTGKDARWIGLHEGDFDEAQMATWIRQAAGLPGWGQS